MLIHAGLDLQTIVLLLFIDHLWCPISSMSLLNSYPSDNDLTREQLPHDLPIRP
jgi:hypothetical protein